MGGRGGLGLLACAVCAVALGMVAAAALNTVARPYFPNGGPRMKAEGYVKNPHTFQQRRVVDGEYRLKYGFKDHQGKDWLWEWGYGKKAADDASAEFGLPKWFFTPRPDTPKERARMNTALARGMFALDGSVVTPDYSAMVTRYRDFTKPLYDLALRSLGKHTRDERIEFLMKFVQDIPYGIPPDETKQRVIMGTLSPPAIFIEGWGDCDTKAVLFSAILAHDPAYKIAYMLVPDHLFTGIEGVPKPYQTHITHRGRRYIVADPTGPGRVNFGSTGDVRYQKILKVIPMRVAAYKGPPKPGIVSAHLKTKRVLPATGLGIVSETVKGHMVTLTLRSRKPVEVIGSMTYGGRELPGRVFVQKVKRDHILQAMVSKKGDYKIAVFARAKGSTSVYDSQFEYPFTVKQSYPDQGGFPAVSGDFTSRGVYLHKPMAGELPKGSTRKFDLVAPGAREVQVTVGKKWIPLKKQGHRFRGDVKLTGGKVIVWGKYTSRNEYTYLLEYKLR